MKQATLKKIWPILRALILMMLGAGTGQIVTESGANLLTFDRGTQLEEVAD